MSFKTSTQVVASADSMPAISVSGLGKCYRMYEKPSHRLWQGLMGRANFHKDFWALRGVDLQITRGETFGVIGKNGSGKSTLLQIIAGTLHPTEGTLNVNGRVAALLELGSGFNPDFTGRENVYLNATILGLTRNQIDARMQSILEFADIGEFIDQPVRSYSSGMVVRLAFAVIVHVDADILIIDEALSVGDAFFSQKCMRFLRDFQKLGTLLFVSHDAAAVTNLCSRAIWLDEGTVRMIGSAQAVVESYMTHQHADVRNNLVGDKVLVEEKAPFSPAEKTEGEDFRRADYGNHGVTNRITLFEFDPEHTGSHFGAGLAKIKCVAFLDEMSKPLALTAGGEVVRLRITFHLLADLQDLIAGFYVKDRLGQRLFGDNTHFSHLHTPISGRQGDVFHAEFKFRLPLMPQGSYMIDAAVASGSQDDHTQQHWIYDALEFKAIDTTMRFGLIGIPMLAIDVSKEADA
jgi:lipopolysaccharide transport system ATP-binding protein